MAYLLVGLGNPEKKYESTRHNIGFRVLHQIAAHHHLAFATAKWSDYTTLVYADQKIYLIRPTTYMNQSGEAVAWWTQKKAISPENTLIIYDDLHLPLGKIRLRKGGGTGGHNGLKSIAERLQTSSYPRLRLGIGNDFPPGKQSAYVLSPFSAEENRILEAPLLKAHNAALDFVARGIQATMREYN